MGKWQYTKGLHEVGRGTYAWLQPDGSWGWSNAGLITDGDRSLLVDTLYDMKLTGEMLEGMRKASRAAQTIQQLVNTHANGDHCYGNGLVASAEIIASQATADEMKGLTPEKMGQLVGMAKKLGRLGKASRGLSKILYALGLNTPAAMAEGAPLVSRIFAPFDYGAARMSPPTRTFQGELNLQVGEKEVRLLEVGPAHTKGDTLVYVPADKVIFTGDILFVGGHPILWEGPLANWVQACDRMLELDVEVVVPGHGPVTDLDGVRRLKAYLETLDREGRRCYQAGLSTIDAARELARGPLSGLQDPERLVINLDSLYRELGAPGPRNSAIVLFAHMARFLDGQPAA